MNKENCTLKLVDEIILCLVISRSVLITIKSVSDTIYRETQNTHLIFNNFLLENHAFYEIMWKKIIESGRPQMTTLRMLIACWIPKATNTHTHTHRLCNSHCLSTTTVVARTRLNVTLYALLLSCFKHFPHDVAGLSCRLTDDIRMIY